MFLASVLTYRISLLGRPIYSLGGDVLPMRAPLARLASPCSPAARPLRAGVLFAQEGGVRPSRRERRCRQTAGDSSPGANLPRLSNQPSAPRYTSGAIRAARPATRSFGWSQNLKMLHVLFPPRESQQPELPPTPTTLFLSVEHCSAIPCHSMLWGDVTLQFVLYFDIVFDVIACT